MYFSLQKSLTNLNTKTHTVNIINFLKSKLQLTHRIMVCFKKFHKFRKTPKKPTEVSCFAVNSQNFHLFSDRYQMTLLIF